MENYNNSIDSLDELFDEIKGLKVSIVEITKVDDLNSFEDACKVLNENPLRIGSNQDKLFTIIKAANYLDNNNKIWKANFLDNQTKNHIPYFQKTISGWVFAGMHFGVAYSSAPVGFYFKEQKTAEIIANKFIKLYDKVLG